MIEGPPESTAFSAWKVCPRHTVMGLPYFTPSALHVLGPSDRVDAHGAQSPVGSLVDRYGSL